MPATAQPGHLPPRRRPLGEWGRGLAALVLAWTAGYVDAVGYLDLAHVYTSHMTGNTAALGQYLSRVQWPDVVKHGWPILAFVVGLLVGAAITEAGRRHRFHSRLSLVMAIEIVLLVVLAMWGAREGLRPPWWVALPALAMGMQTVTITRIGDQRVYSTYMTGNLAKFAEAIVGYLFWIGDQPRPRHDHWLREALRHTLLGHALLTGGLWVLFLVGAVTGARRELHHGLAAMWWPVMVLGALIALDLLRPIAAATENEPMGFHV